MQTSTQPSEQSSPAAIVQSWVDDAVSDGETDAYTGKRRWPRVKWQVPVTIEARTGGAKQECRYATSRDVSPGGIGVWCSQPVTDGTIVRLSVADGEEYVDARVQQCTETVGGYIVGLEFLPSDKPN